VSGWLKRWRTVAISDSFMLFSRQPITFFKMALRPLLWATTAGFNRAVK
jgi:hypothetical protein